MLFVRKIGQFFTHPPLGAGADVIDGWSPPKLSFESSPISFKFRSFLPQLSFCFWLSTDDGDNYGTPLSYATAEEDNELTLTDYSGFVLAVAGRKVVTDVAANGGDWTAICVSWYKQLNACVALEFCWTVF